VYLEGSGRLKKRLVGPVERWLLRHAEKVVATCEAERSWIEAYEPRAKVELVDLRKYDWGRGTKGQAACHGSSKPRTAPLRVLYMGRRHPLKGLQYLEKAVSEANSDAAGDSKHWNLGLTCFPMFELRIVTDAHGAEKESAFDWCDVFCLPTLSENFGIVVAEALARGKPVVTTDGAPAWADEPRENPDGTKRLVYIEGYRDAAPVARVQMLKDALRQLIML
jgi:glycosyltransferase involved in cell wall biosynthesis